MPRSLSRNLSKERRTPELRKKSRADAVALIPASPTLHSLQQVCLGASAAQALLGKNFRVTRDRGNRMKSDLAPHVLATAHPASILRGPDPAAREQQRRDFVRDMLKAADLIKSKRAPAP